MQPSFILLIDEWDMGLQSRMELSLITEQPFRGSENDSGVIDRIRAIQSEGINNFIDSYSRFFESLLICGIVRPIYLNIIANDFPNPKC